MCTVRTESSVQVLDHNRATQLTTVLPTTTATAVHTMYLLHMLYLLSKEKAVGGPRDLRKHVGTLEPSSLSHV